MERTEIQSQWEHENSRLQNFRSIIFSLNIVLLSLFNFKGFNNATTYEIFTFFVIIVLGVFINLFWILIQYKLTKKVDLWGNEYLGQLAKEYLELFEKTNTGVSIRKIYIVFPYIFGLVWIGILFYNFIVI